MAITQLNPIIKGTRGSLGKLMFRQVGGKTILSAKPSSPKKQSEQQRANRLNFREASGYAKHILKDPQKKAYYQQKAKKLKLPNAYTAALTEFLRKGEIKEIQLHKNKNAKGNTVRVRASKKDFSVRKIWISIYDAKGTPVLSGEAIRKDNTDFVFHVDDLSFDGPIRIKACINDVSVHKVEKEICL